MDENNLSVLLDELSSFKFPSQNEKASTTSSPVALQDQDVNQYFLNKSKAVIEAGVNAIQDLSPYVTQGQNPDEIAALAELMSATTKALDTLNKGNLIDKKAVKDEKLKRIDIQGKKELLELQPSKNVTNNTNVLIASREEIMQKLFSKKAEVIEIEDK
jgi:hypothetical protein